MTHALALVLVPSDVEDINEAVSAAMAPYSENVSDDGWWDWWQIGGRYTGAFGDGYNPAMDPRNWEECLLCKGTGKRDDVLGRDHRRLNPGYTCNGCDMGENEALPLGWCVKWPTQWVKSDADVMPVRDWLLLPDDKRECYAVVGGEIGGHERTIYVPDAEDGNHFPENPAFAAAYDAISRFPDALVVAVDYHS